MDSAPHTALLIIDMQPDFMPGGPLAVADSDTLIPVINQLQQKFELVIATQDWHPAGHESFIHTWPVHCVQGTSGAALHPKLNTHRIRAIIRKGTDLNIDSYSAFYDNQHKKNTGLGGYLHSQNVQTIYFCGLCADICVYYSIEDALAQGFKCVLVEDATKPYSVADFAAKREQLIQKGVSCVLSSII